MLAWKNNYVPSHYHLKASSAAWLPDVTSVAQLKQSALAYWCFCDQSCKAIRANLVTQAAQDASEQEMQKFLAALAQLSSSSSVKAMQTTYGPLQVLSGQAVGSHIMFTRLSLQEQLDSLLSSPPYIALAQGNPRLPAKVVSSYAMHIEPAQTQKARAPDGQGVLGVSNK